VKSSSLFYLFLTFQIQIGLVDRFRGETGIISPNTISNFHQLTRGYTNIESLFRDSLCDPAHEVGGRWDRRRQGDRSESETK
jgi:hypothetical protein